MADVLSELKKSRKLHHQNHHHALNNEVSSAKKSDKNKKISSSHLRTHKKAAAATDHDLVGMVNGNAKDSFKSFDFIHGENLFDLDKDQERRAASLRKKGFSERKWKDGVSMETRAQTEIKMKVPRIHEPRMKLHNPERDPPLKVVKRRLDFDEVHLRKTYDDESDNFDFTDKLAALRSLMGTGLKTSPRSLDKDNTKYSTRLSGKVSIIDRSDSLKENKNHPEIVRRKKRKDEARIAENFESEKIAEGQSDAKITDDRLSTLTVNLHTLKNRLFEGRKKKLALDNNEADDKYLDKFVVKSQKVSQNRNEFIEQYEEFEVGDALDHISPDRKIISSTKKFLSSSRVSNSTFVKSNFYSKEIQTDSLRQSTRSVQSNAPLYDHNSVCGGTSDLIKPSISPHSSVRKKFDTNHNLVNKEGISEGVNLATSAEVLNNSSHIYSKQTNVDSFVGTSLTPEKVKGRLETESVNKFEIIEAKVRTRKKNRNCDLIESNISEGTHLENYRLKEKYMKVKACKYLKSNLRPNNSADIRNETKQSTAAVELENINVNNYINDDFAKKINGIESKNKTEKKVREWINQHENIERVVPEDAGPMTLDELSVSLSAESKERDNENDSSRGDAADKFQVKLGKLESERKVTDRSGKVKKVLPAWTPLSYPGGGHIAEKLELDGHPLIAKPQHYSSLESLTSESKSSIFSLPISVKSGESVSSTVQAVKLLRKLYNVDTETRQNLVLMARCFRRWLNNVLHMKAQNYCIQEAARVSPVSYGVMLRKGEICYRSYILGRYVNKWKSSLAKLRLQKAVKALQRKHLLRKGMNAFKWSINRSQLRQGILQDRVNAILLSLNFNKWKTRAEENRLQRLKRAFGRWRQFTKEAQKNTIRVSNSYDPDEAGHFVGPDLGPNCLQRLSADGTSRMRMLRNLANQKIKGQVFTVWCERYKIRQKQHKADAHFRTVLISHGWLAWRQHTVVTIEKKQRAKLAIELYESRLERRVFSQMKVEYVKYTKAKSFHRSWEIKQALRAWKAGSRISKGERENDLRVAVVYWSHSTLRSHFVAWRDELLNRKACRLSDRFIIKHMFAKWSRRHEQLIHQNEAVDSYLRQKIMYRALKYWCNSVIIMKRRRAVAVECIESVLQRHTLSLWHGYTVYQKDLKKRLHLHTRKKHLYVEKKCLGVWRSHFNTRIDEQKSLQLWSNTCVRRAAEKWRMICHRSSLEQLLVNTEPVRQLNTQKVFFLKWRAALGLIETEKQEAADVRAILDRSQLWYCFDRWRSATIQLLKIKPMVMEYRQKVVTMCFKSWLDLVRQKRQCKKSELTFQKIQLRKKYNTWRRQYLANQVQKDFTKRSLMKLGVSCLQGWRFVIQRKHLAEQFHDKQLVRSSFNFWSTRTLRQLQQKHMEKVEYETVMSIKREYFDHWRQMLQVQQNHTEECVTQLQQQQADNRVRQLFNFWRRHFRATLIASKRDGKDQESIQSSTTPDPGYQWESDNVTIRHHKREPRGQPFPSRENEKIRIRRLAKQALQEWHNVTQKSLEGAVARFAAAIGLHQGDGNANFNAEEDQGETTGLLEGSEELEKLTFEPMNPSTALVSYSPRTPRTPRTPRHASSCGTPLRRLFSPSLSHQSLAQSMEFESATMLSSSFLDARFEMEHAVKTASRREIVVTVVSRLRNWPLSILFDQWNEFTARQQEFKSLTTQMVSVQEKLEARRYFNMWTKTHQAMKLAKQHYEQVLQHKALLSLVLYRNSRKEKKHMASVANAHFMLNVFNKIFPVWFVKAQEKHQREHIVHLWTNITPEEQELIPRERSFRYQLNRKSLQLCFNNWKLRYSKIAALKKAYHRILLERCFGPWCNWALERHDRHVKSEEFQRRRITTLAFKTWCVRYVQKTEVARRYEEAWHNYLGLIVHSWSRWAKDQRRNQRHAVAVSQRQNTMIVFNMFNKWKQETKKLIRVKQWYETRLTVRTLLSWQSVAGWQKDARDKLVSFRLKSYTRLAKQTFQHWHQFHLRRQLEHEEHTRRVQQKTIEIAKIWKYKAQETRGQLLQAQIQTRHLQGFFDKWKSAHNKNVEREDQLKAYLGHKNGVLLQDCLDTWRTALMGLQAGRVFYMKLLAAFVSEWRDAAKACLERRQNLIGYQKSRERHTQKGYFLYWFNVAKARKSIRGHANLKIQLTVFKSWLLYTRKANNLRRLEKSFTRRKNERILTNTWYTMTTRFHYCLELTHMAERVILEKNQALMKEALNHWDFRLKVVIAGECHQHLLAKRVARTWSRFVTRKRQERQHEQEQMAKAKRFCERKLCNMVFGAWYNEVLVSRQILRHKARIEVKYGLIWKHKVDLMYTAKCMRKESQLIHAWQKWHKAFTKQKAIKKVEAFERKQSLTMVFVSWRNLCKKRKRASMIPLPVSPAFNMPSAGTSSSSTPTDEVLSSPTFGLPARPSQIPAPSSRRSKLLPYNGKTSTNLNIPNGGPVSNKRRMSLS